ncbi:hypothetical protein A5714_01380 [Mycobacterium sp. E2462]|uniref:C40 family peptidase n=1 Tax=Mycobacterium sp. E2462 TaxID=1834133 RepID=UPI0007FD3A70|nr:C40 family peptidase [Mycobacterium sp. E2462]OBI14554.1 hypothetical protein A5714_01380 [Mycobacterium sp. E2462]
MSPGEVEVLTRAHQLFAGNSIRPGPQVDAARYRSLLRRSATLNPGLAQGRYARAVERGQHRLAAAEHTDAALAGILAAAERDRTRARDLTGGVVAAARAEAPTHAPTPMAQREAVRRRIARLRAQHAHVTSARVRARRRHAQLQSLRYQLAHQLPTPTGRAAVAVRAALSRLGRPYVWGATGPEQFDCSGLVQWSYAQAGVRLDRTTYQQIHDGIPVPRGQVRPGDLVFPHTGHVQLALGNGLVIEAPHPGASVRISRLGNSIAIRRPL